MEKLSLVIVDQYLTAPKSQVLKTDASQFEIMEVRKE